MGKLTLMVAVGACVLACGAEPGDDAVDEHSSSEEASTEEASTDQASSKATDDEQTDDVDCSGDADMSTPEAAQEAYARLRGGAHACVQVTRRGKPITIEYSIK